MIRRFLVPMYVRQAAADPAARPDLSRSTPLDARIVVPAGLPIIALDGKTSIPAHLPLDVLAERFLVPRDMPATPLETAVATAAHFPTVLDSRVAVPKDARPAPLVAEAPIPPERLPELLEPTLFTTGEVNFLARPIEGGVSRWRWAGRVSSAAFHALLILLVLLQPKLFPYEPPTPEELELARKQLSFIYLPPPVVEVPKLPPPADAASPQIRIDPRVLRQVAPPAAELKPTPGEPEPERVVTDSSSASAPHLPAASTEAQPRTDRPRAAVRLETPKVPENPEGLLLPRTSPGKALEESLRGALKGGGSTGFGGAVPSPGGGGGTSYLGGNIEMLTPTEGVDFTNYLARVLASVKRNWYAVIPESARMGDKGKVVLQFRILRDGNVPFPEPALMAGSGKEPLDRAALSSIRASSPFEPLPPAFSGPFIELRFIFLYNLPLSYQ